MHWEGGSASREGAGGLHLGSGRGSASREWAGGLHPGRGVGRSPPPRYMGYYGIRSTSGRCASYWNAFLFKLKLCEVEENL